MNLNTNDYKIITTTWRLYVENGLVREQKTRKKKRRQESSKNESWLWAVYNRERIEEVNAYLWVMSSWNLICPGRGEEVAILGSMMYCVKMTFNAYTFSKFRVVWQSLKRLFGSNMLLGSLHSPACGNVVHTYHGLDFVRQSFRLRPKIWLKYKILVPDEDKMYAHQWLR